MNQKLRKSIEDCSQCEEEENGMVKMCFKHQYIVKKVVPQ
jgi:hypothetical protein